jgi:HSP20 family protein
MATINVQKVETRDEKPVPILEEIEQLCERVRDRAFEYFDRRGQEVGHALQDWLRAERDVFGWSAAELTESQEGYELEVTLPGFTPEEVEVTAMPDQVLVHASSKHEHKGEGRKVVWSEYGSNDVYRRFELPDPIDVAKASAALEHGILHIKAAKAPAKATKVTVAVA